MKCLCRHEEDEHKLRRDGTRGGCNYREKVTGRKCNCKSFNCGHWRIKRNYPHGKKSRSFKICKDCGEIVSNKFLEKRRENERTNKV